MHQDQLGSTRALTDSTATVKATYTYDAYGNTTSNTGTSSTPLQYSGQYLDAETNMYYLRARYYDPATGQFITRDPIESITGEAYSYAAGNPLNLTDPSGLSPNWGQIWSNFTGAAGFFGCLGGKALQWAADHPLDAIMLATMFIPGEGEFVAGGAALKMANGAKDMSAVRDGAAVFDYGPAATNIRTYNSFGEFKAAEGSAGNGYHWHHIVENTSGMRQFTAQEVQNTKNILPIPGSVNMKLNGTYARGGAGGQSIREFLVGKSYTTHMRTGIEELIKELVKQGYNPADFGL